MKDTGTANIKQNRENKAVVVTLRNVHYTIVRPVVEELRRREWKVTTLRIERIWERVESFLSKKIRKRLLESFYVISKEARVQKTLWGVK